jgi:DNA primase catalytic core
MSNINDFVNYELYPALFDVADKVFDEHKFIKYSYGWGSNTYLNGNPHARKDKTVITTKAPYCIMEQGGEVKTIINYVMERDRIEFIEAVRQLSNRVRLQLPDNKDYNSSQYSKGIEDILEDVNNYFVYLISNNRDGGEYKNKLLQYLEGRGYNLQDIETMELGYCPNISRIEKHLSSKSYDKALVDEALGIFKNDSRIGDSYKLSIPYRSGGRIKGFKFRAIDKDTEPKYLNTKGMDKKGGLFNIRGLRGDKDLIIVEGELDCLHAEVKGIDNIVATGGSSVSPEQIKDSILRGVKKFTICFDREPDNALESNKKINKVIDTIIAEGMTKIYIATLPDIDEDKVDPDSLIASKGIDAFKDCINNAMPYYEYRLQSIIDKYGNIEQSQGDLTPKDRDGFLEDVLGVGIGIPEPLDKDIYYKLFLSLEPVQEYGITEDSLLATEEKLIFNKGREQKKIELNRLLSEANKLQSKGDVDGAIELIQTGSIKVKVLDKQTEFNSLLNAINEVKLREILSNKPNDISSGIKFKDEYLYLPSGAISIFCAPTSHGKTTMLINLAINTIKEYKDKNIYFFSYEEAKESILMYALNTFIGEKLSNNNRRSIKSYFTDNTLDFMITDNELKDRFKAKKDEFFREYIDTNRLNINYVNYDSDMLIEAIRYLNDKTDVGAVFIDYMQLLSTPKGKYKTYSRQEELKTICLELKDLSVDTGIPIILGAQFNREVVNPLLIHPTKIGEAGDIERIANLIVGLWDNKFKSMGTKDELKEIDNIIGSNPNTMYANILKRRGYTVNIYENLEYDGNLGLIKNRGQKW